MTILLQAKLWITPRDVIDVKMRRKNFLRRIFDYFHLKRVMAKLQHMCLCECDHPLQIKTIREPILSQTNGFINLSGRWESNPVYTNPNRVYYRYTTARFPVFSLYLQRIFGALHLIQTYVGPSGALGYCSPCSSSIRTPETAHRASA